MTIPSNIASIVNLLEKTGISWAEYEENMPTDRYLEDYTNSDGYTYYSRKHNPLASYDSVANNHVHVTHIRNFNDFAYFVRNIPQLQVMPFGSLNPLIDWKQHVAQWFFVTPNMKEYILCCGKRDMLTP